MKTKNQKVDTQSTNAVPRVKILRHQIASDEIKSYVLKEAIHHGCDIEDQNLNDYKRK